MCHESIYIREIILATVEKLWYADCHKTAWLVCLHLMYNLLWFLVSLESLTNLYLTINKIFLKVYFVFIYFVWVSIISFFFSFFFGGGGGGVGLMPLFRRLYFFYISFSLGLHLFLSFFYLFIYLFFGEVGLMPLFKCIFYISFSLGLRLFLKVHFCFHILCLGFYSFFLLFFGGGGGGEWGWA